MAAVLVLAPGAGSPGAPGAAPADLPANRWVKVGASGGGGVRRGSAVVWLGDQHKFLVLGGVWGNERKGIDRPYEVQTFDPAARRWQSVRPYGVDLDASKGRSSELLMADGKGRFRLHGEYAMGGISAYDPAGRRVMLCQTGSRGSRGNVLAVAAYDVASGRWELLSRSKPPADANGSLSGEWGGTFVFMQGVALVADPVNDELLFLGGRTANADNGFVGHWALSLSNKRWRRMKRASSVLDGPRAACLAARRAVRDALAAARNAFYASPTASAEKAGPGELLTDAVKLIDAAADTVKPAKADDWEARAAALAGERIKQGAMLLPLARRQLAGGAPDAAAIRRLFDAAWRIDEAADLLRCRPGPRMHAGVCFDPHRKCIVLFGGDHGDYLLGDTWVYDCPTRRWRRAFPPVSPEPRRAAGAMVWLPERKQVALVGGESYVPKFMYFRRIGRPLTDVWAFDADRDTWTLLTHRKGERPWPALTCQRAAGEGDVLLGLASEGRYPSQWDASTWLMRVAGEGEPAAARKLGVPVGSRSYLSVVKEYDPCWYDGAAAGEAKADAAWLAALKPNTWTPVPLAPRPAPRRDWGTAAFDPHRDQFYHWTGGHMADPASIVSTYHVAAGRWSIPYVAEYFGKGIGFNGRPDCMNHTYLNYAYDTASRKLVCTSLAGTSLYDPDRREFGPVIAQPFRQHPYYTKTVATPHGVVCWSRGGYLGLLDARARRWKQLPVKGKLPRVVHGDENAITYDAKRNVIWLMAADGYQKPNGQVWRYGMTNGEVRPMDPKGMKAIGRQVRPRESAYLPPADLVLHNAFASSRQLAYDPAGNRWVVLNVTRTHKDLGGVSIGLMYDARRRFVWAMSAGQRMFVLKLDADTLEPSAHISEASPAAKENSR